MLCAFGAYMGSRASPPPLQKLLPPLQKFLDPPLLKSMEKSYIHGHIISPACVRHANSHL